MYLQNITSLNVAGMYSEGLFYPASGLKVKADSPDTSDVSRDYSQEKINSKAWSQVWMHWGVGLNDIGMMAVFQL
jgi:hypothetical protein